MSKQLVRKVKHMINWEKYNITIDEKARIQFERYFNDIAQVLNQQQLSYKINEVFDELESFIVDYITTNRIISVSFKDSSQIIKIMGSPEEYKEFSNLPALIDEIQAKSEKNNKILCPNCNSKNDPDAQFCDNCGSNLKSNSSDMRRYKRTAIVYILRTNPAYFFFLLTFYLQALIFILGPFSSYGSSSSSSTHITTTSYTLISSLSDYLIYFSYILSLLIILSMIYDISKKNSSKYNLVANTFILGYGVINYLMILSFPLIISSSLIIILYNLIFPIIITKLLFFSSYSESSYFYSALKIGVLEKVFLNSLLIINITTLYFVSWFLRSNYLYNFLISFLVFILFSIDLYITKIRSQNKSKNISYYKKEVLQIPHSFYTNNVKSLKITKFIEFVSFGLILLIIDITVYYLIVDHTLDFLLNPIFIFSVCLLFFILMTSILITGTKYKYFNDIIPVSLGFLLLSMGILIKWDVSNYILFYKRKPTCLYYPTCNVIYPKPESDIAYTYLDFLHIPTINFLFTIIFFLIVPLGCIYLLLSQKERSFSYLSSKNNNLVIIIVYITSLLLFVNLFISFSGNFALKDVMAYYLLIGLCLLAKPFYDILNYIFSFNNPKILIEKPM